MNTSLILLANDITGLEVTKFLKQRGDKILRLYIHSEKFQKLAKEIIKASGVKKSQIFFDKDLKDPSHIEELKKIKPDYIVSVYWKWILSTKVLKVAKKGNVNFHPALLPVGRGWYPHVMSFVNGTPTGVTLHQMDEGTDTGPIWIQKKVPIETYDTSKEIYLRLQNEIIDLFKKSWPKIISGKIKKRKQNQKKAMFYTKEEVAKLDTLDPDKMMKVKDVINLLRARSFGDLGFASYKENGKRVFLNLRLSETSKF